MVSATGWCKGRQVDVQLAYVGKTWRGTDAFLEESAAMDFLRMASAAGHAGVELVINSAFRFHEEQERLFADYQRRLCVWSACPAKLPHPAPASKPGYSLHESGKAVDIDMLDDHGKERPAVAWLREHAAEYGFRQTVACEPWHWEHKPEP